MQVFGQLLLEFLFMDHLPISACSGPCENITAAHPINTVGDQLLPGDFATDGNNVWGVGAG